MNPTTRRTRHPAQRIQILLLILAGAILGFTAVLFNHTTANALGCGAADCYVDSSQHSSSSWWNSWNAGALTDADTGVESGSGSYGTNLLIDTRLSTCSGWGLGSSGWENEYPARGSGSYRCFFPDASEDGGIVCPPQGDRAANGRIDYRHFNPETNQLHFLYFVCLYPTDDYAPIERIIGGGKIYTGGQANFHYAGVNATARVVTKHGGGGTVSDTTGYIDRGVNLSDPEPWVGDWKPHFTARTMKDALGNPTYGFYRLDWKLDYRLCEKWAYPAWLNEPVRYDCARSGTDTSAQPYTYACNFTPPLVAGVKGDAKFIAADCASGRWECVITDATTVLEQDTFLSTIRTGEPMPVHHAVPTLRGDIISDSDAKWEAKHTITEGATPDPALVRTSWKWDKWIKLEDGEIGFNWATLNEDHPFSWSTDYRFKTKFYLPTQDDVNGASVTRWIDGNADCGTKETSPDVEVLRAVTR